MRTELARVQTEAQKQSFIRNGFDEYEFIVNSGCCPICQGLDGKHFKVEKMMPGENAPPMHPHCRCSTAAYSDRAEYQAWLEHLNNGGTTDEWNKLDKDIKNQLINAKREELKRSEAKAKVKANFDITEGGKYEVLPFADASEYQKHISPEYNAQRMTNADNQVLWAQDGGYIQNSDGYKDINGYMRGLKDHLDNPKCQNTIDVLTKRTASSPYSYLRRNYVGYRKVSPSYLQDVLGLDTTGHISSVGLPWEKFKDAKSAQSLAEAINNIVGTSKARVTDKAFTSISLCEKINFFKHRPVQFEIQMPEGTKGLITSNWEESEFIAKPNTTIDILGAKVYNSGGKPYIKIFARLIQE